MPDPKNDGSLTGSEFGEVVADGLNDTAAAADRSDVIKSDDEAQVHPS